MRRDGAGTAGAGMRNRSRTIKTEAATRPKESGSGDPWVASHWSRHRRVRSVADGLDRQRTGRPNRRNGRARQGDARRHQPRQGRRRADRGRVAAAAVAVNRRRGRPRRLAARRAGVDRGSLAAAARLLHRLLRWVFRWVIYRGGVGLGDRIASRRRTAAAGAVAAATDAAGRFALADVLRAGSDDAGFDRERRQQTGQHHQHRGRPGPHRPTAGRQTVGGGDGHGRSVCSRRAADTETNSPPSNESSGLTQGASPPFALVGSVRRPMLRDSDCRRAGRRPSRPAGERFGKPAGSKVRPGRLRSLHCFLLTLSISLDCDRQAITSCPACRR